MAKTKEVQRLSDSILGDGMYEKLNLRKTQISSLLTYVDERFTKMTKDYSKNQAILLFMNGRVDKFTFDLAAKVLQETEKEIAVLYNEKRGLETLLTNISEVLTSINKSRQSEVKILKLEKFMNRQTEGTPSIATTHAPYAKELERIKEQARLLEYSATAFLELKVGK